MSLNDGITGNICYYIKLLLSSSDTDTTTTVDEIREIIIKFVKSTCVVSTCVVDYIGFQRRWSSRAYKNDLHYLLAFICRLQTPINMVKKSTNIFVTNIFVKPCDSDIEFISRVENEPIPIIKKRGVEIDQIYNTLGFKRYFKIHEDIGAFKLSRFSVCDGTSYVYNDFLRKNWFHWEYYAAASCPLWRDRLEKYSGILDPINKQLVFPNDAFYDLYAYEFDEQPKEIQMMSHCDLDKRKWYDWYFNIFPEQTSVVLKDDFEFLEY